MSRKVELQFGILGARAKVQNLGLADAGGIEAEDLGPFVIDIRRDEAGEYFDVMHREDISLLVLDIQPKERHLLLQAADGSGQQSRFLCGHDERAWFVAAIPERAGADNVQGAMDALKPKEVWDAMREYGVPMTERNLRKTDAFVRQGEWFFIPRPRLEVDHREVRINEPIRRGKGKPHMCDSLYRIGGQQVHVSEKYPNGLTNTEVANLLYAERSRQRWETRVRDAQVFVRGSVRHADHETIWLNRWHQVVMNTESQAKAMRDVAFLD